MKKVALPFGTPNPIQQRTINEFRGGKRIVTMVSGRQGGKALALDTRIPTPSGWTTMGELRVGDSVIGSGGTPTTVINATEVMRDHEVFEVEFSTGEVIVADADHQWFTLSKSERKHGKPGTVRTTKEIASRVMVGAEFNHYVPHASPVELPERPLPLPPYVLGVWLGDGTCGQPHVTIGSKPDIILPRMEADGFALRRLHSAPYRYSVGEKGNRYRPCALTSGLESLGVYREKSIPQEYLRASAAQRRALYDGLMDTDGHVDARGHAEITFRDRPLIEGMRELVASLGYKPGKVVYCPKVNAYRLKWLERDVRPRAIVRVSPVPSVPVRCIEVDAPDHLFLVGDGFIPTHNSHFGARWLIQSTMNNEAKHKLAFAVAPTYRMARVLQRKMEEVLKADKRLWDRIKHTKQPIPTYEFPNGWVIEVHSSDDPDALRGPTVEAVWYDEVAKGQEASFDILMPTLLAANGRFLGTTTPRGKQNWVYRRLYLKSCPPGHPDHDPDVYNPSYATVIGSTWDNVDNLSEEAIVELEDQYGKDSAFGRQEISGEFVSYEGLVYTWDEANYLPMSRMPKLDEFSLLIGVLDFGYTDPTAAVVLGYKDGMWFALDGFYESKMQLDEMSASLATLSTMYRVETWVADSAKPETITELNNRGIPVIPVVKPEIEERVREMAIFANNNRLKVSYRVPFVRDELQSYQYPEEDKLLRDKKRNPLDKNNHAMDAIGYGIWTYRWLWRNDARYKITKTKELERDEDDEALAKALAKTHPTVPMNTGPAGLAGQ